MVDGGSLFGCSIAKIFRDSGTTASSSFPYLMRAGGARYPNYEYDVTIFEEITILSRTAPGYATAFTIDI